MMKMNLELENPTYNGLLGAWEARRKRGNGVPAEFKQAVSVKIDWVGMGLL